MFTFYTLGGIILYERGDFMYIHRLNKESLSKLCNEEGYKICVCEDRDDQKRVYETLKLRGRCARAALIKNKEGKTILIVVTKEKKVKVN